jgi:H+/Cl- antiporter ClcA
LPDYPTVRLVDVAWCTLVAAVAAAIVVAVRRGALRVAARAPARPTAALVVGGLLVGALAVAFRAAADRPVELVLFSGQASLPEVLAESSSAVLVLLVVAKALAYGLSLGVGFRGGPVFPALVLGVALGVLAELVLPGLAVVPAIVAGVAGSAAAVLRMPFFAVLVAALLAGPAAVDTAPIAILAAVIGWLLATAVPDR